MQSLDVVTIIAIMDLDLGTIKWKIVISLALGLRAV